MNVLIHETRELAGAAAAAAGASRIRQAIAQQGGANIIVATGASQFEMFDALVREPDIRWERVTAFHLDEYVGLHIEHPASFRGYLWKRFHSRLPAPLKQLYYIGADGDAHAECRRVGEIIARCQIDVCFAGIGENAHLAFNDPPADFDTQEAYRVVTLDEVCREQQVHEGWFKSLGEVPQQAVSMCVRQILKSRCIIATVPDRRKARAVRDSVEGPVTNKVPSSILQTHPDAHLYLDSESASLLAKPLKT